MQQRSCSISEARELLFGVTNGFFEDAAVAGPRSEEEESKGIREDKVCLISDDALLSKETQSPQRITRSLGVVEVDTKSIVMCAPGVGLRKFEAFDRVITCTSSQVSALPISLRIRLEHADAARPRTHISLRMRT